MEMAIFRFFVKTDLLSIVINTDLVKATEERKPSSSRFYIETVEML